MENIIFCGWMPKSNFNVSISLLKELKKYYNIYYFGIDEFKEEVELLGIRFYSCLIRDKVNESSNYEFLNNVDDISEEALINHIVQRNKRALEYHNSILNKLIDCAREINPKFIFRDNSALFGKFLGDKLKCKVVSFNSMLTILDKDMEKDPIKLYPFYESKLLNKINTVSKEFYKKSKELCKLNSKEMNLPYVNPIYVVDSDDYINISFGGYNFQKEIEENDKEYLIFKHNLKEFKGVWEYDRQLERILSDKKPLIYVSSGTILTQKNEYYNNIINNLYKKNINLLISIPTLESYNKNLPQNVLIRTFVPQKRVLEKASVMFSSGGYNSICEAINSLVPIIVTPIAIDQDYNGYLISNNKLGELISIEDINEDNLNKILNNLNIYKENVKCIKEKFFTGVDLKCGIKYIMSKINGGDN